MNKSRSSATAVPPETDSFSSVEQRLAVTQRRLPGYPVEYATLTRLTRHLNKRTMDLTNEALQPFALNYAGYNTLMMIYGSQDNRVNASELAEASGEKRANVTRICDELVTRKLIVRVPGTVDRRSVVMSLTAAGERLIESLQPTMRRLLELLYRDFTKAEMKTLRVLLRRQLAHVDRHSRAHRGQDN